MVDDVVVGDDVAVSRDEEAGTLRHGHVMLMARRRPIALVLVVGHAELLEEAVERAAGREVRHASARRSPRRWPRPS